MEKICLLVEAILLICFLFLEIICKVDYDKIYIGFIFCFLTIFVCAICQSVFLGRIIANNLSYDCSDDITNELLRKENENTKKSIVYTAANLGVDFFVIFINILSILICMIIYIYVEEIVYCPCSCICCEKSDIDENNSQENKYNSNKDGNNNPKTEVVVINRKQEKADNRNEHIPENNLYAPPNVYPENNSNENL